MPSGFGLWNWAFSWEGGKSVNLRFFSFTLGAFAFFALFLFFS
jgi:hypothetical protein